MKGTILFCVGISLLYSQFAFGQTQSEILQQALRSSYDQHAPAAKATAVGSRLVSFNLMRSDAVNYVNSDSASFTYTGVRGGEFADLFQERSKYDMARYFKYNTVTSAFDDQEKMTQTFDANNNATNMLDLLWDVPTSSWLNNQNMFYTYDASNNRLTRIQQGWAAAWVNQTKTTYTYDANNNVSTVLSQSWNNPTSTWVNSIKVTNLYNAANKITQAFKQVWNGSTMTWDNSSRSTYTYDANSNNLTQLDEDWNSSNNSWDKNMLVTNTFSASNQQLTKTTQYWNSATSVWVNNQKDMFSDFVGINPQTDTVLTWNTVTSLYENHRRYLYTYNTYGQPLTIYGETWNVGGFWQPIAGDLAYRLHYEDYTTDVKEMISRNGTATIYPVPAKNILNIDLNWNEPQPFTVSIIDLQGRLSHQWQVAATASYHTAIPVNEMPFGTYFIKIDGSKGQVVKQLIVSPQ